MPFKPRLVHQTDPEWDDTAELHLPDDLAELGEQLCSDADYLAQCYPADSTAAHVKLYDRGGAVRWWSAAAVACLLLATGVWGAVWLGRGPETRTVNVDAAVQPSDQSVVDAGRLLVEQPWRDVELDLEPPSPVSVETEVTLPLPAAFLQYVSGPELEGMLDLLEGEPPAETQLSI